MRELLKFGILFVIASVILSLLGSYLTNVFGLFGATMTYVTTGSIGLVFSSILSYIGWFLDLLFLTDSNAYYTLINAPSVSVGSIAWALTAFRVLAGAVIFVLLFSLIFGKRGE